MSGSPPKSIFLRPPRYGKLGFVLPVNPVVLGLRFCDPSVNLGRGAFPLCPESILRSLAAVCEFSVLVPRLSHGRRVSGSTLRSVRRTGRGRRPVGWKEVESFPPTRTLFGETRPTYARWPGTPWAARASAGPGSVGLSWTAHEPKGTCAGTTPMQPRGCSGRHLGAPHPQGFVGLWSEYPASFASGGSV